SCPGAGTAASSRTRAWTATPSAGWPPGWPPPRRPEPGSLQCPASPRRGKPAGSMQEQIREALRRGAHDEALVLAREAVEADPGNPTAHRLMARALHMGGDPRGALEAIDRAIAISPDDAGLHFHRAGL